MLEMLKASKNKIYLGNFLDGGIFFGSLYKKALIKAEEDWPGYSSRCGYLRG